MRLHKLSSMILAAAAVLSAVTTQASVALFDSATDTIQVGGHTILGTAATYEARVLFTSQYDSFGDIYDEWSYGLEDKQLSVSSHMVRAYSGPIHYEGDNTGYIVANCSMSLGTWHHVAYVYDGSKERIYVDGQIGAERASSGNIGNGEQYLPQIGGIMRPNLVSNFQGYLDTLRISDVARYSGDSFTPPSGKLASDSHTALLYNFDETPGSTTITDLSENGLNGTLGVGFSGATSPEFVTNPVPEPSTLVLLAAGALGFLAWAWRRRRA